MNPRKPKVCILSTSHAVGDDRVFHKEATSLAKAGYEVSLVVQHDREEVIDSVRIIPLRQARTRFGRYVTGCLRALVLALRARADLYHLHDPELVAVGVLLKLARKRVIYDAHEDYEQKLLSRPLPKMIRGLVARAWGVWERCASRLFDHVITADSHTQLKFPASRTTVIANYPPLKFAALENGKRHEGDFRVMYVGGLGDDRGIGKLVEAIGRVRSENARLHVAGAAPNPEYAGALSRHPRVSYHGKLPWEQVKPLLATGHVGAVVLQPVPAYLYCPGENIIKLFEYMAVGLPVLISSFPKLKALIETIDAGIAVDPTSPEEIARAIDYLHDNPEVWRRMSENGRRAVLERYNWEHEEKKLLDLYARLLPNGAP